MKKSEVMEILQRPFPAEDIEWRIAQCGMKKEDKGPWAKVLAYITARAVHERLDEAFGLFGWKNEFREFAVPGGEENGAPQTGYEAFKGGLSDSEKRTFAELGGGRYLYKLTANWAIIGMKKDKDVTPYFQSAKTGDGAHAAFWWGPPKLPAFALPGGTTRKSTVSSEPAEPEQEEEGGEEPETKRPVEEPSPFTDENISTYPNIKLPPAGTQGITNVKELIGLAQVLGWSEVKFGEWYKGIVHKNLFEVNAAQATLLLQKIKAIKKSGGSGT